MVVFLAGVLVFLGIRALPGDPAIALGGPTTDLLAKPKLPYTVSLLAAIPRRPE